MLRHALTGTARAPHRPGSPPTDVVAGVRDALGRWRAVVLSRRLAQTIVLVIAAVFTGFNMFHYPQFESDEGTYVGSAWAMLTDHSLSYYTYTYDHPPFGWVQVGLWVVLTGGFDTFGMSVNSGRALMLVATLLSALLVFEIVRYVTSRLSVGIFAGVIFSVTPMAVSLHRQVLLDNLATFWLLLTIYLLATANERLGRIIGSAIAFGLTFWTKEVFIIFVPGLLYLARGCAHPEQRRFATGLWASLAAASVSLFVLIAVLKNELLPPGVLWTSSAPHVSMVDTYIFQASRGGGGSILSSGSSFWGFVGQWRDAAPLLLPAGALAAVVGLVLRRRDRFLFGLALLIVPYALFLGRGGVVLYYYVIPLIALMALAVGVLLGRVVALAPRTQPWGHATSVALVVLSSLTVRQAVGANRVNFRSDPVSSQHATARWIAANLPRDSAIIMDSYLWTDLRLPSFTGGRPFSNAHYYWPALQDPAVRDGLLHGNWKNIDYLAFSPSTEADLERGSLPLVSEALEDADVVQIFPSGNWSVKVMRVRKLQQHAAPDDPLLTRSWATYVGHFIEDGRVLDRSADNRTTSEGQAYAMLRAVYMNDRATFDAVWSWTQQHLQTRGDGLLSWLYGNTAGGAHGIIDRTAATDADQDAALALLFAARRWAEPTYQAHALAILDAIWEQETIEISGDRVLVAGDWARGDGTAGFDQPLLNPSYLAPYAWRIFAEVDPEHDWLALVDSCYEILNKIAASPEFGGAVGLAPDWLALDPATGELVRANLGDRDTLLFSFDAARIPLRIGLDWLWNRDERAKQALEALHFPADELRRSGRFAAAYHPDGSPAVDYESTAVYAGVIPSLLLGGNEALAHQVFSERILRNYVSTAHDAWWGAQDNYYDQNIAWFTSALMDGALANLWAGETEVDWDAVMSDE